METKKLLRVPAYSQHSVAIAYSLLDQNKVKGKSLNSFVPAFDCSDQINRKKTIDPTKYVEIDLNVLENCLPNKNLVDPIRNAQFINADDHKYIALIEKLFQKNVAFLNQLLPNRLVKNKTINSIKNRVVHYFNIMGILLTPMEVGPNRLALLFRAKELTKEREDYEKKVGNYAALLVDQSRANNLDSSYLEMLEKEKKEIDELRIKIDLKVRTLNVGYFKYLMEITKYVLSNLAFVVTFSPFKTLIDIATIVQRLPGVLELIDFGLSSVSRGQMKEKDLTFNQWEQDYKKWKLSACPKHKNKTFNKQIQVPFITGQEINKNFDWNFLKNDLYNIKLDQFENWDRFIENSQSLWEKRLARREKKVVEIGTSDTARLKVDAFLLKCKERMTDESFQAMVYQKTPLELLRLYVDDQERINDDTRNLLMHIVSAKIKLEKKFLSLKSTQHNFFFYYSAMSLTVALILGVMGGAIIPAGIATGVFLGLAITSAVISLSFWLTNYLMGSHYRSHKSGFLNFHITFLQLMYEISNYWLKVQEAELSAKNSNFALIIKSKFQQPMKGIEKKELNSYQKLEAKTSNLYNRLEQLKLQRRTTEALDFYKYAKLDDRAPSWIIQGLREIDFDIVCPQLKDLIQMQLGIDIDKLQRELSVEDPKKALDVLRKDLLTFFTLDDTKYAEFMKYQKARLEAGNLK